MALLRRRQVYDRRRILDAAAQARARGRRRQAIRCYRRVLAVEPRNPELHRRIAPLLAASGESFEAWLCFETAARALLRANHQEAALSLYREAVHHLPGHVDAWLALAQLEHACGREREAQLALRDGSRQLWRRRGRAEAIHLLRRALELGAPDAAIALELARRLMRVRRRDEARLLLERLAARSHGPTLRRVRAAQLALCPCAGHAWRWLRAPRSASA